MDMKQSHHVGAVRIVGTHPQWETILRCLTNELTISVMVANVWVNAFSLDTHIPDIKQSDSQRFSAAIGLALPIGRQ